MAEEPCDRCGKAGEQRFTLITELSGMLPTGAIICEDCYWILMQRKEACEGPEDWWATWFYVKEQR